jgi:NTE family protein
VKRALILAGGGARGAFQIGVWKYLTERNWKPDIICGTSIGAINAAGIGSGNDIETLLRLWTTYNRRKIYRLNLISFLAYSLSRRAFRPLLDTRPLEAMVSEHLDLAVLHKNPMKIVISAVDLRTARPRFFDNKTISVEHIMASSAMPILFPWYKIDTVPHWDGGIMANVPLLPALEFGADEIIVVLLSPVGHTPQPLPKTVIKAGEHVLEQFLAGSYQGTLMARGYLDMPLPAARHRDTGNNPNWEGGVKQPRIITLAPSKMLGFRSLLRFSFEQARNLIIEGYQTAYKQLRPFK